jgi:hypothetical protein
MRILVFSAVAAITAMWLGTMYRFEAKMDSLGLQMGAQFSHMDARVGNLSLQVGAQATQLSQMDARVGNLSLQMDARVGNLSLQMGAQATQLSQMDARVGNLSLQMGAQATQLSQMDARMDALGFEVKRVASSNDAFAIEMGALTNSVNALLTSTLTPAAAQRTLECAQASVYALFLWKDSSPHSLFLCSAFAYKKLEDGSTLAISAAHCFVNTSGDTYDATRLLLAWGARVRCQLLTNFTSDSAVLRCKDAAPVVTRALAAPRFAQAVVAAGFHSGALDMDPLVVHKSVALFMLPSSIAATMGPMPVEATSGHSPLAMMDNSKAHGFIQGRAVQGMSGGPILDAQCGVVGILHAAAKNTAFVSLDEVDEWLRVGGGGLGAAGARPAQGA